MISIKLKLTKRALRNAKAVNDFYDTPEGKEARLKAYDWGAKVLDS